MHGQQTVFADANAAAGGEAVPTSTVDHIDTNTDTYAMQTAMQGGTLKPLGGDMAEGGRAVATHRLVLDGVGDTAAVLPSPSDPASGVKTGPHEMVSAILPRFAMLYLPGRAGAVGADFGNGGEVSAASGSAATSKEVVPDYRIVTMKLLEALAVTYPSNRTGAGDDGRVEYIVQVLNGNYGAPDGGRPGSRFAAPMKTRNVSSLEKVLSDSSFTQGNLLVDLVDLDGDGVDEERKAMSLAHMDSTGELAYNVKRYDDSMVDEHDPVKAYGLIRTGWIPYWTSPIYWVCCPTSLIVCPLCFPWTIFCCF